MCSSDLVVYQGGKCNIGIRLQSVEKIALPFLCFSLGGKSTLPLLFAFPGPVLIIKLAVPGIPFFVLIYGHAITLLK